MLPLAALFVAVTPALELALPPQDSVVVLVVAPGVAQSAAAPSALIRATAEALEAPTGLRVSSVEQAGLDVDRLLGCPPSARLGCWTRVCDESSEAGRRPPSYLLVLSVLRRSTGPAALSALLVDLSRARTRRAEASDAALEADLDDASARAGPVPLPLDERADYGPILTQLFGASVREALARAGRWGTVGAIELDVPADGCLLEVDHAALGAVPRGRTRLTRVPPGAHALELTCPGRPSWRARAELDSTTPLVLEATLPVPVGDDTARTVRLGGLAGAALGVGLAVAGGGVIAGRAGYACVGATPEVRCAPPPSGDAGGLLLGLGAGLGVAGAGLFLAALGEDVDAPPPWAWAVSAALGVGAGLLVGLATP